MLLEIQWPLVHIEDSKQVLVGWLSKAWNLKGKLDDHLLGWNFFDTLYHYLWPECITCWQWTPLLRSSGFVKNPANLCQRGVKSSLHHSLVKRRHGCHRSWVTVRTTDGAMLAMKVVNELAHFLPCPEMSQHRDAAAPQRIQASGRGPNNLKRQQ